MELIVDNFGVTITLLFCLPIYLGMRTYYLQGKPYITAKKVFLLGILFTLTSILGMFPYDQVSDKLVWWLSVVLTWAGATLIFMLVFWASSYFSRNWDYTKPRNK